MEAGRIRGRGIEWEAVRALLARETRTAMGRERAADVEPLTDLASACRAVEATSQARRALAEAGPPPLDTVGDVRAVLDRCRLLGSLLEGPELVQLIPLLEAGPRLTAWGRTVSAMAPGPAAVAGRAPRLAELRDQLDRCLDDEGALADEASPRLRQLRRELRERRRRLVGDLERWLTGPSAERLFADRYVTIRHGRYVLPVRAEARGRVPGIVHDRSQSGQTIFVEPADFVEANNDLVQLVRDEEAETTRILAELTDAVRARLTEVDALVDVVAELDSTFARAYLAERMNATAPALAERGPVAVRGARHPLLLAQSWQDASRPVVPVDLELTPDRPVVVITGPNAGGKTIALKTLALLALMAQTGCHLPAETGARLPVFHGLHAIIGDDQSVAENLSTFSAFVKQVREILAAADDRSLVLLDELGAGTDPDEGAALAQAILEELGERGSLVLATTHLEPLKAFASTHPRARNASVEFDTATLAPTFRLRYDRPGQSLALTIAARLGLTPALIERAQSHRSRHAARIGELLQRLDEFTRDEAERTLGIEQREQEAAARLAAAQEAQARAEAQARDLLSRAKADAAQLLADVRRAVSAEWERLKRGDRSRRDSEESRRRLGTVATQLAPAPAPVSAESPAALTPGTRVTADHLGLRGTLVALDAGTATVRAGNVTVRVPIQAIRLASGADPPGSPGRLPRTPGTIKVPDKTGVGSELHLLGRTTDEARDLVEQYLDDAFMAGLPTVRLVHGKGTGALRKAVRDLLAAHPLVESYRDGQAAEGGTGATVAALRVGA